MRKKIYSSLTCGLLTCFTVAAYAQTGSNASNKKEATDARLEMPYQKDITPAEALQNTSNWNSQAAHDQYNSNAWLNLLIANRQLGAQNFYGSNNANVQAIADTISRISPNSFEAHYANYLILFPQDDAFKELRSAIALRPDDPDMLAPSMVNAIVNGDEAAFKRNAKMLYDASSPSGGLSPNLMSNAKDVSRSIVSDNIVVCEGEMDCYPLWVQQAGAGQPSGSTLIVDRQLLGNARYRQASWARSGMAGQPPADPNSFIKALCLQSDRQVYLTLSLDPELIRSLQGQLYLTGLAFRYSRIPFNNIPELETNWLKLIGKNAPSALQRNYLVPALVLRDHYERTGATSKASEIKTEIRRIALQTGQLDKLKKMGLLHD